MKRIVLLLLSLCVFFSCETSNSGPSNPAESPKTLTENEVAAYMALQSAQGEIYEAIGNNKKPVKEDPGFGSVQAAIDEPEGPIVIRGADGEGTASISIVSTTGDELNSSMSCTISYDDFAFVRDEGGYGYINGTESLSVVVVTAGTLEAMTMNVTLTFLGNTVITLGETDVALSSNILMTIASGSNVPDGFSMTISGTINGVDISTLAVAE